MYLFLTVVQAIVAALLVAVILMQKSEGGGLGTGGSGGGLMSARGAANFMTRATAILATAFVGLSIALAALAVSVSEGGKVDTSLNRDVPAAAPAPSAASNPIADGPTAGAASGTPATK